MSLIDKVSSWWEMEESSGNRNDSHGSNTLTANNGVSSRPGKIGNGADFVYTDDDYLSMADNSDVRFDDSDIAFGIWFTNDVLTATVADDIGLISKAASVGSGSDYDLTINDAPETNQLAFSAQDTGSTTKRIVGTTLTGTGTPIWVAVYFDASANEIGIRVDGGSFTTTSFTGTPKGGTGQFRIGARFVGPETAPESFDGVISQVVLFNEVPTSSEWDELYNSGNGVSYDYYGGVTVIPSPASAIAATPAVSGILHTLSPSPAIAIAASKLGAFAQPISPVAASAIAASKLGRLISLWPVVAPFRQYFRTAPGEIDYEFEAKKPRYTYTVRKPPEVG